MPTVLKRRFALRRPINVKRIEPATDTRTSNDMDDIPLRNTGKYDKKILTFSDCDAEGFELNARIHKVQTMIGISSKTIPAIDVVLLL